MSFTQDIVAILELANAKKQSDKRKSVEQLLDKVQNQQAEEEITRNSGDNGHQEVNWNNIFCTSYKLLNAEFSASGKPSTKNRENVCMLVFTVISKAGNYLKCSDVMRMLIKVLESDLCTEHHQKFIDVLVDSLLPKRHYQIHMQHENWSALLAIFVNALENARTCPAKFLEGLEMVIQFGYLQSHLVLEVKKLLPFLAKLFHSKTPGNEDFIYKLTCTVLKQIGMESRIEVCKFAEEIIPFVTDDSESLWRQLNKCELLLLLVTIHNTDDTAGTDEPQDCLDWNDVIKNLYRIIMHGIKDNAAQMPKIYIELGCEVLKRKMLIRPRSQDGGPLTKRRRVSTNLQKLICYINEGNGKAVLSMVEIITMLVERYPEIFEQDEFVPLLKSVSKLFTELHKNEDACVRLCESANILLHREDQFVDKTEMIKKAKIYWDEIWDCALRLLSTNHKILLDHLHSLLQLMIEHEKCVNPRAFLRSYLTSVKWSRHSVQTLLVFCENHPLPNVSTTLGNNGVESEADSLKLSLMKWALDIPWYEDCLEMSIEELSKLLIGLTLKSWFKKDKSTEGEVQSSTLFNGEDKSNIDCLIYKNLNKCYKALEYKMDTEESKSNKVGLSQEIKNIGISYDKKTLDFLLGQVEELNSDNTTKIHVSLAKTTLICKLTSCLLQLDMVTTEAQNRLSDIIGYSLNASFELITADDIRMNKYFYLTQVTTALTDLYQQVYHQQIEEQILTSTTRDVLKSVYSLVNISLNLDDEMSGASALKNQPIEKIKLGTLKALTLFCCKCDSTFMNNIQENLLKNVLKLDLYEKGSTADFEMAMNILELLSQCEDNRLGDSAIENAVKLLVHLYTCHRKDEKAVRWILRLIPRFLKISLDRGQFTDSLIEILSHLRGLLSDKRHGPLVHLSFVECLCEVAKLDPSFARLRWTIRGSNVPIVEEILTYVNSPFYLVRLQTIDCLKIVFSSRDIEAEWKIDFFKRLKEIVIDSFVVDRTLEKREIADERETRVASTLHIFACVVSASGFLQNEALMSLLQLTVDKSIKVNLVKQVLSNVKRTEEDFFQTLIKNNIEYLLTRWIHEDYSIDKFPWVLIKCQSCVEFIQLHMHILMPIFVQVNSVPEVINFCASNDFSFDDLFEGCFPSLVSWLLPCKNLPEAYTSIGITDVAKARAVLREIETNAGKFATFESFAVLINKYLSNVVVNLIKKLHDDEHFEQLFKVSFHLPETHLPSFNEFNISKSLSDLQESVIDENVSLTEHLSSNPSVMQKILLSLTTNIFTCEVAEHKIKAIHQYAYFCKILFENINCSYFDGIAMFVVRDVTHTLCQLTREKDDIVVKLSCTFMHFVLKSLLPKRYEVVKDVFSLIVTRLTSIVERQKLDVALEALAFLIIEQQEVMADVIMELNFFPKGPEFNSLRGVIQHTQPVTLEKEIENFLAASDEKVFAYNVEELCQLRKLLENRKSELEQLYSNLERLRGFTEDYASIPLLKLINRLLKLSRSSDRKIALEASKCLGELGPADLTTMILHPEKKYLIEGDAVLHFVLEKAVGLLSSYVVEGNIKLRNASADALYLILSTNHAQEILANRDLKHSYIEPFLPEQLSRNNAIVINQENVKVCFSSDDLWTDKTQKSYKEWLIAVTSKVVSCFKNPFLKCFIPICENSIEFCEEMLPRLFHLIISEKAGLTSTVCNCINSFFRVNFDLKNHMDLSSQNSNLTCNRESVQCMLNVVNFMRIQSRDKKLELDYAPIAKAAQFCSAYFTSILYTELSCQSVLGNNYMVYKDPLIEHICENVPEPGKELQALLREAYTKIGVPDAIHGCGLSHLQDPKSRIQHYIHMREWEKAMQLLDIGLDGGLTDNELLVREFMNSLHQSGLDTLLSTFIKSVNDKSSAYDDFTYECAWRMSNWNLVQKNDKTKSELLPSISDYHYHHYDALKCLHENDDVGLQNAVNNARREVIKTLNTTSVESSKTIYSILSQLQMLREVEELSACPPEDYSRLFKKWKQQEYVNTNDFQFIEPILTQRLIMYDIKKSIGDESNMKATAIKTHLDIAKIADEQGYFQFAAKALATLSKQSNLAEEYKNQLIYQEALLSWKRGNQDIGRYFLKNLISRQSTDLRVKSQALRIYGNWMAETKSENPNGIVKKYYLESVKINLMIPNRIDVDKQNEANTRAALAQFAGSQYKQIVEYLTSPQFEMLMENLKQAERNEKLKKNIKPNEDVQKSIVSSEKRCKQDRIELQTLEKDRDEFLRLALENYLTTLQLSDEYDYLLFRLVSLWFENRFLESVNRLLNEKLITISSSKFVNLIPQFAAHMSDSNDEFSTKINSIVSRCADKHPHHTIPIVLALKNLHADKKYTKENIKNIKLEPRVIGASRLIDKLHKTRVKETVMEMEKLSEALVELAYKPIDEFQSMDKRIVNSKRRIPSAMHIAKIKNLNHTLLPTLTIDVRKTGNYDRIIGVQHYELIFEGVGGMNAPKKIVCVGTDGIPRTQLIKGKDDMRQDAVMQQVFTVMNSLLRKSKETRRRKLNIRTYKVIPLTQRSGILQWCENTTPIMVLLQNGKKGGAHAKYYPRDVDLDLARKNLKLTENKAHKEKFKAYTEICEKLHPAFHHVFTEIYPSAEEWFERRLAYTKSIATNSIIGYIVGLGDRHLNNILIDKTTAEVIHIDFGIAFDQGKVLRVPETVPFRLTRDIEIAMGVSGVEGIMRRSCEESMNVLRDQREIIITLLQVLLYDPLYSWAITPSKAYNHQHGTGAQDATQSMEEVETNKVAERALLRVEQKLQGTEEGVSTSIAGQVERLIQQARDPSNLCSIFSGWQPYL